MRLRTDTTARAVDVAGHRLLIAALGGRDEQLLYDRLVIGGWRHPGATTHRRVTGHRSRPGARPADGAHVLHTMGDMFAVLDSIESRLVETALVVGAGYIGLEMVDALTVRGIRVTQVEALPQVLPMVDPELAAAVQAELTGQGVEVLTGTTVTRIARNARNGCRLTVTGDPGLDRTVDLVLVVVGVQPDTALAQTAGATLVIRGAVVVDDHMRTGVPGVFAAGDCVHTHHRLVPEPGLPAVGNHSAQAGPGRRRERGGRRPGIRRQPRYQVVKVFYLGVARTGLRDHEAAAGYQPVTVGMVADDHKRYYPGAHTS